MVHQVAPQTLYENGLTPALHWLSNEMARLHELHVKIQVGDSEPALDDEVKTLLFESIREMLFNVVKHAKVDEAKVVIQQEGDCLNVTVSDEGVGFDVEAKASEDSQSDFGIFSRGDRIEALGGHWSIDASPGHGTRVQVQLPVNSPPTDESAR